MQVWTVGSWLVYTEAVWMRTCGGGPTMSTTESFAKYIFGSKMYFSCCSVKLGNIPRNLEGYLEEVRWYDQAWEQHVLWKLWGVAYPRTNRLTPSLEKVPQREDKSSLAALLVKGKNGNNQYVLQQKNPNAKRKLLNGGPRLAHLYCLKHDK